DLVPYMFFSLREIASMGPSRVRDGDDRTKVPPHHDPAGFNGAVACSRRRRGTGRGPGAGGAFASMGPSRVRDGDSAGYYRQHPRSPASMGPSRVRDGDSM